MTSLVEAAFRGFSNALVLHAGQRLLDCNDAALKLFCFETPADFLTRDLSDLSADPPAAGLPEETAAARDPSELVVRRLRRRDGTVFLAESRDSPFAYGEETVSCLSLREVSEHGRTVQALEASQSNLRLILDSLPGRVAWISSDRRFRYFNRSFEAFSGQRPADIIGCTVAEIIGEAAFAQIQAFGEQAMAGSIQHWEGWLHYQGRGRRFVQRTYAPSYREDGVIDGYFVFSLDVTEQKLVEEELQRQREALHQSEKLNALGSLLAGVAHELNNPLAIVLAQASLLRGKSDDPSIRHRSERISAAAERCARIVRSFLAIARQRPPTKAVLRLDAVVQSALDLTGYGLKANGIAVAIDLDPAGPEIVGDADHLVQVLMNLLVNAQHALQEREGERRIRIATVVEGDSVTLRLEDNGPGIPPEIASRIFDPFFTTKPEGLGTGIGLSVCHGIVSAHGGTIVAEETPGGGATFAVRLPGADAEIGAAALPEPAPVPKPGGRAILVVDDEPDVASLIAEIVAPLAARVDVAGGGLAALERLGQARYDLVISDLRMPDLDGPALHARMAGGPDTAGCPVLFVTGDTLHHRLEAFGGSTGAPILAKPFTPDELRRRVGELLDGAANP